MRKLASIQRIESLDPIPYADAIQKATVQGWELVVAIKDKFQVGHLCVYVEIDSILPDRPEFEFLRARKFRIKTIKLKGQVSQGIAFPLSILPRGEYEVGQDVTELLGVTKYDPQAKMEQEEMDRQALVYKNRMDKFLKRYGWYRRLTYNPARLPFPKFIPKTDETRVQNMPWVFDRHGDKKFWISEKLDGQSFTAFVLKNPVKWQFWKPYIFGVCSRNFQLVKENNTSYWNVARKNDIKARMFDLIRTEDALEDGFYIQGEIVGPGIQGNKYHKSEEELYLYQAAPMGEDTMRYNLDMLDFVAQNLEIPTVPVVRTKYQLTGDMKTLVESSKGLSTLFPTFREGLVYRTEDNVSFKVINPDFLLDEKDENT